MVNSILQQNTTSYNGQFSKQQRFGLRAEQWATHYLAGLGYDARLMSRWTDSFDILVNGLLKVEVKISRPYQRQVRPGYYRPAWQFDTGRLPSEDMLLILVCEDDQGQWWPYVLPSWLVFGRLGIAITSHPSVYRGRLRDCLNCWANVSEVLYHRRRFAGQQYMLPLFDEVLI